MNKLLADRIVTPIGDLVIVADGGQLVFVDFGDDVAARQSRLARRYGEYALTWSRDPHGFSSLVGRYFGGELDALDGIPATPWGTPFQQRVWEALRAIPPGQTTSYGELAETIGAANGARAVGAANAFNPICVVIPCHRVLGADGMLTGYSGGLARKRWLLHHEGARFREPGPQMGFTF